MTPDTDGIYLENLSWPEAGQLLAEPHRVVILPVGARCKQHGAHLPLNTDWLQAEYFTARLVERLPVLALPTVQYGHYPAFVEYPGSVNLDDATFEDVLTQICGSVVRFGVRRLYFLNMGISTLPAIERVSSALAERGIRCGYTHPGRLVADLEHRLAEQPFGGHADEMETSVMLHIAPERVDMSRATAELGERSGGGPFRRRGSNLPGFHSPSGVRGDARLASAEKGRRLVAAMVEALVAEVRALREPG